ncbi:MAG TPA: hypothetical protein DGH68_00360, partial [Bacteroidetes bacterium]|nr:hypothetical protein [Bacteroidota bacterium]
MFALLFGPTTEVVHFLGQQSGVVPLAGQWFQSIRLSQPSINVMISECSRLTPLFVAFLVRTAESMRRIRCVWLLIAVGAAIQLVLGASSLAQFVSEEISVRVHGDYCMLDGRYEFRNTGDHAVLWPIFYPLLNTDAIPLADSVHIHDAETEELLPFESGVNGVSFALNMPPRASKVIRISYRQRT